MFAHPTATIGRLDQGNIALNIPFIKKNIKDFLATLTFIKQLQSSVTFVLFLRVSIEYIKSNEEMSKNDVETIKHRR